MAKPGVPMFNISTASRPLSRLAVIGCASGIVIWIAKDTLAGLDWGQMRMAFSTIGIWQWIGAAFCVWASFLAVGCYDSVWHRVLRTGIAPRRAGLTGMAAIALGQAIGVGAVSGALVRWHCLPELTLGRTTRLSASVAISFLCAWVVIAGICAIALNLFPIWIGIAAFCLCLVFITLWRRCRLPDWCILPSGPDCLRLLAFTALDLLIAGCALYFLVPPAADVSFAPLLAAFILGLGVRLFSNIPAGAGVLKVSIIWLLAPQDPAPILAGLLGFRVMAYLAPAILAMAWLAMRRATAIVPTPKTAGEWDLARQSATLVRSGDAIWMRGHLCGLPVTIGNGSKPSHPPCLTTGCYKVSPLTAASLRRKLRQAEANGLHVTHAKSGLPIFAMENVAAEWAERNGGELGFSMGRFDPQYVAAREVFLVWQADCLIGFAKFQNHGNAWSLDLMRHNTGQVQGAMQLAIVKAIEAADAQGADCLSLAATFDCPLQSVGFERVPQSTSGLTQFKNSFAPRWRPLYHAAPNRLLLILTLFAVTIAIQRPIARLLR